MPSTIRPASQILTAVTCLSAGAVLGWFLAQRVRATRRSKTTFIPSSSSNSEDDDHHHHKDSNSHSQSAVRPTIEDELRCSGSLKLRPIGVVRSIYRLCVGTPRQGLLAPMARGRIELYNLDEDAIDGLQSFSHIWVLFIFHLNTTGKKKASKIAPPALGGIKVGVLSTRSPHRQNPIGMTLCKLDRVDSQYRSTNGRKSTKVVCLHVSGIDLVDGTPVLDIKPYVPVYDSPVMDDTCVLPSWVSGGLATQRPVSISKEAKQQLNGILASDSSALDFYHSEDAMEDVSECIQQVLCIDVRSSYQTQKARQGKSQAERAKRVQEVTNSVIPAAKSLCTQQLDNLLIHYTVSQAATTLRSTSEGSGAEDHVLVTRIELLTSR